MYSIPAWLQAMACGSPKSAVPSVGMPSAERILAAFRAGPVEGILMQYRSREMPARANSRS